MGCVLCYNGGINYNKLRELLLSELGFDPALFEMQGLRAGGAAPAANIGVEDRLYKWHGR